MLAAKADSNVRIANSQLPGGTRRTRHSDGNEDRDRGPNRKAGEDATVKHNHRRIGLDV